MGITKRAQYKVFNGTDFDAIHFETEDTQVYTKGGASTLDADFAKVQQYKLTNDDGTALDNTITDFNLITKAGQYVIGGTVYTNTPTGSSTQYGMLEVLRRHSTSIIQRFFSTISNRTYTRFYNGIGWSSWDTMPMTITDFVLNSATNGYQKLPSGLIIQWGIAGISGASYTTVTFPITFPTYCLGVVATVQDINAQSISITSGISNSQFQAKQSWNGGSLPTFWIALGY